jgi:hypothetical protein
MARSLSLDMLNEMYAEQSGVVVICLLTIEHPSWADPIRISSDPTERVSTEPLYYRTMSRGDEFFFAPFQIQLPDDVEDQAPSCNFMIENVSRDLIGIVRSIDLREGPAQMTIELVTSEDLDTVEIEYPTFEIRSVQYNATTLTFSAQIDHMATEPFPSGTFDPSGFPAIHGTPNT